MSISRFAELRVWLSWGMVSRMFKFIDAVFEILDSSNHHVDDYDDTNEEYDIT